MVFTVVRFSMRLDRFGLSDFSARWSKKKHTGAAV